ncbi:MAG: DUF721 domain-containing protein [Maritimibacter sp.]
MRGFERTSSLLTQRIREAGESRGFAVTRLITHWEDIVGEATARICRPTEVSYKRSGFGATLTLLTTGAQAPMLEMQKEKLREKVNTVYGYSAISHIRITQTAPTGFAEGQAEFRAKPKAAAPQIDPEIIARARSTTKTVGDEDLRFQLERLAENVYARQKSNETTTKK